MKLLKKLWAFALKLLGLNARGEPTDPQETPPNEARRASPQKATEVRLNSVPSLSVGEKRPPSVQVGQTSLRHAAQMRKFAGEAEAIPFPQVSVTEASDDAVRVERAGEDVGLEPTEATRDERGAPPPGQEHPRQEFPSADLPTQSPSSAPADFTSRPPIPDGFDPTEDEDACMVSGPNGWWAVGVSARGLSHAHHGKYREDAFALRREASWLLAAVCDGGGSYRLSRLGAREASEAAATAMAEAIQGNPHLRRTSHAPREGLVYELILAGLRAAHQRVNEYAASLEQPVHDLSTTLLLVAFGAFANGEQVVGSAQIGDGAIGAILNTDEEQGSYHALGEPDSGAYAGYTDFLTTIDPRQWPSRIAIKPLPPTTEGILLLTDGVSDDFKPHRENLWRVLRAFRAAYEGSEGSEARASASDANPDTPVSAENAENPDAMLPRFRAILSYERSDSFDDRTAVVIHRPITPATPMPPTS